MTLCLFTHLPPVGIVGLGHALPATTRGNDADAFALSDADSPFRPLFTGYGFRRVLGRDESLAELMSGACRQAIAGASVEAKSVDLLTGYASVSDYVAPNELYRVHQLLELPTTSETLPLADEFTTFISGVRVAAERIWTGSSRTALVACGCRWSSNVDYREPVSVSIGDGAGAAVVRLLGDDCPGFRLVGCHSVTAEGMYGVMRLAPRKGDIPTSSRDGGATTPPLFNMLRESEGVFRDWGVGVPPRVARELLDAASVGFNEVTCIAHQASSYLLDAWRSALAPIQFEDTLQSLGNMTLASLPVTLCLKAPTIRTRFVLLLGLGLGIHTSACLLERR
jgi:3-oxoacyl-[acyl-carrier-protein] synthase III